MGLPLCIWKHVLPGLLLEVPVGGDCAAAATKASFVGKQNGMRMKRMKWTTAAVKTVFEKVVNRLLSFVVIV